MTSSRSRGRLPLIIATGALVALGLLASPGIAAARSATDVVRTGTCTASSDWTLQLNKDNGRIEVQFEVDSNVVGQTWNVALKQDGTAFWSGQRTTKAPSGSFEVTRFTTDRAGIHTFVGRARNPMTGEVCRGAGQI